MNEELVPTGSECPKCGENRTDHLGWDKEGIYVTCHECGCMYEPPEHPRSSQNDSEGEPQPVIAQPDRDDVVRCPKCGREVKSLQCGHCGSQLPDWQADLYGATIRQIAKLGGRRADDGSQGGEQETAQEDSQGDGDQPKDNGGASTPDWLFDRCNELAIQACGEPMALDVAAADWNHKCDPYFTEEDDGLKQVWDAKAVWCNPPYSATIIERFVRKAIDAARSGTTTICLLPWWNYPYLDLCEQYGRLHRIPSPVTFRREDGSTLTLNNGFRSTPLVVVVLGPTIRPGFGAPITKNCPVSVTLPDRDEQPSCGNVSTPEIVPKPKDDSLQNTETPPSLCRWIHDRLADAGLRPGTILDPCAGNGNLTRPFRPHSEVIEYEVRTGNDFFDAQQVMCDLVLCNPPWSSAEHFLRHIVRVVGRHTPIVLICPAVFLSGYKDAPVRQYLQSPDAPRLHHCTPLPSDTFVRVYSSGVILWLNLPDVCEVALVPSDYLIRSNSIVELSEVPPPVKTSLPNRQRRWPTAPNPLALEEVEAWRRRKLTEVEEAMRRFFEDKSWLVGGPIPLCLLYDPKHVALLGEEMTSAGHEDAVFGHDGTDLEQLRGEMKRRGIDERYHWGLLVLYQRICRGVEPSQARLAS